MGALISALERLLNDPARSGGTRKLLGVVAVLLLMCIVLSLTLPIALALRGWTLGWAIEALLATPFLAQKSLGRHVEAVADGLDRGLAEGRAAVAHIVGRDPAALDESGVSRAAIESLAENASDGVVAPVLWLALLGLPGIVLYKAINTADSMIGHKSDRYRDFGRATARLDDLVNLPASRLSGLLFALAAWPDVRRSIDIVKRDAGKHVSPNAGWPEAAVAGALGIRLGGPRSYEGRQVDLPWLGEGRADLGASDIRRALALYRRMLTLLALTMAAVAVTGLLYAWP